MVHSENTSMYKLKPFSTEENTAWMPNSDLPASTDNQCNSSENSRYFSITAHEDQNLEAEDAIMDTTFRNSRKGTLNRVLRQASISRQVQRSGSLLERQYNRIRTIINWFENNMLR